MRCQGDHDYRLVGGLFVCHLCGAEVAPCVHTFKSAACGYSGEGSCDKSPSACVGLGNFPRFGGFPAVPRYT